MYNHYLLCNDTVLNRTTHKTYLNGGTIDNKCSSVASILLNNYNTLLRTT